MSSFTVIISDAGDHDEGFRGTALFWQLASRFGAYAELGLYWFLCAYYGRDKVRLLRPSQLLRRTRAIQTDWLFVGLPTRVSTDHLTNVRFKQMALYDATDVDGIAFEYSDQRTLLSHTNVCLKNWRDRRWDFEFQIGLLPIKRPPLNNKLSRLLGRHQHDGTNFVKQFDVGFIARPTGELKSNPRVQWLLQLKRDRPGLTLWGGLVGDRRWQQAVAAEIDDPLLADCWLNRRKMNYREYFEGLCRSRVALAPRGFAPWTYRHYEAIYAKAMLVCNDLCHFDFLVPLPPQSVVEVAEGESVIAAVDAALDIVSRNPTIVDENRRELERWWRLATYCDACPALLERFWRQFT
ncbi:MAG: hypothetical protein R3E01_26625 [Pirellulaceae bacterium]|nr:hypothetical protein [Planctomycetales bacterium]